MIKSTFPGVCLAVLLLAGCSDGGTLSSEVEPGEVLAVKAAIVNVPDVAETRAADVTNYDRRNFVGGDIIRIERTKGGSTSVLNYTLSGSTWGPSDPENSFRFESAATYRASFPADYTSIRPNQTDTASFRQSNLLKTPVVGVSRLGIIDFTGDNIFVHENVKLTLQFVGSNNPLLTFSSVTVQAPGLHSGGSSTETVQFLRPNPNEFTWQAIVYPKNSTTNIDISFTDTNGVTYKTKLSCAMAAATNYTYTLTIRNNILIAVGTDIKQWESESVPVENGKFDNE